MSAAPRQSGFSHEIEIEAPRARLHAFLLDLHNQLELHPLIVAIEDLPALPERPAARRHRIVDRVPFGPLRLRAVYVAAIEPVSFLEIRAEAWQSPGIHLETTYRLQDRGEATGLVEHVSVEAPWPLRGFVTRQARRAHHETLQKLQAHFATAKT